MHYVKHLGATTFALAVLAGVVSQAEAQQCGRCAGIGYSNGYNSPCPNNRGAWGCPPSFVWGCREIPGNWRTHVWDDYPNEPLAQRWAGRDMCPAAPVPAPMCTLFKRQAAYGYYASQPVCPTCHSYGNPGATIATLVSNQPATQRSSLEDTPERIVIKPATRTRR